MKFRYQYRTRENAIRSGEIAAPDREAAYAELKAKGIKPSRLEEAPGFFNKLFGKGKRWLGIAALAVLCLVLWFYLENAREDLASATQVDGEVPRHQIYGDPAIVARFASFDGLKGVLGNEGDALLACFAQPGKIAELGDRRDFAALLVLAKSSAQPILADDSRELKELRQIVNWMRREMLAYVNFDEDRRSDSKKFESYFNRLVQRTVNEKRVYDMIEQELKDCTDDRVREEKNAKLRRLGLPTIVADEK